VQCSAQVNERHAQQNEEDYEQMKSYDDISEHFERYDFDAELETIIKTRLQDGSVYVTARAKVARWVPVQERSGGL
jgi:hypothetical protein